jgi:large subunit ribosomal protein L54
LLRGHPKLEVSSPRTPNNTTSAKFHAVHILAGAGARSSCAPNTALVGLNYLKDQPPVLALADEEYPPWLWKLLDKSELPDDGPGGEAEKRRLRKENRQRIRDQNFMKTQ